MPPSCSRHSILPATVYINGWLYQLIAECVMVPLSMIVLDEFPRGVLQ
jgi:hypothetical protein